MNRFFCGCFALACTMMNAQEPASLKLVQAIPLPEVKGRFDHLALDVAGRRLFVAALGNDTLEVLDLATGKRVHTITGLSKPQGVAFLTDSKQVVVANGGDGTCKFFDAATFKLLKALDKLDDADNVRFDAKSKLLYVGYGEGGLAVVDPANWELKGTVSLKGHPESFQLESRGSRIFVNVPDAQAIAVVDREKRTVTATWPMTKYLANYTMAFDEAGQRLFVGCRKPARLVVVDTTSGKPVTDLEISGDTDDLFFDAKRKRIYITCGEGFVDIVQQRPADTYTRSARIPTSPGARTGFFSPERDEFFLAVPQRGKQLAELRVFKVQ